MTTGMTIAILIFLVWATVQIVRWTFSDEEPHSTKGPFMGDDGEDGKGDGR